MAGAKLDKNLILGVVRSYGYGTLTPFIRTLGASGFSGDVCLFVNAVPQDTIHRLRRDGIRLRPYRDLVFNLPGDKVFSLDHERLSRLHPLYPRIADFIVRFCGTDNRLTRCRAAQKYLGLLSARYLMYYQYLREHGAQYSRVMLTDVRDVVFQQDPFDFEAGDGLSCFLEENKDRTIASCRLNAAWVSTAFGARILAQIGSRRISCAGVTIGTYAAMMRYLEAMVDCLTGLKLQMIGIDQGIHNYVIYTRMAEDVKFFDNDDGPVSTLICAPPVIFNRAGMVINGRGDVFNVIHQYDRQPDLQHEILDRFAGLDGVT